MLDRQLASFLEEGLSVHIATRDRHLETHAACVTAVLVDGDGTHLTAFVPAVAAPPLLADLEANGQAAVVFARPTDERGCQVKGVFVSSRPASDAERAPVLAQWARFRDVLGLVGVPHGASSAWIAWPSVAIRMRVTAAFDQTPGPGAGAPLS